MATRYAGDVTIPNAFGNPLRASASVSCSATFQTILSANVTAYSKFTVENDGAIPVFVAVSIDGGTSFSSAIAVLNINTNASVNAIPSSTVVVFNGAFDVIRVIASGSGASCIARLRAF